MSANAIETLRDLLANEPEAGRDHKRDMDWCVDCAEWIAENGAAVEALLEAAKALTEKRGIKVGEWDALAAAVRRVETGQYVDLIARDYPPHSSHGLLIARIRQLEATLEWVTAERWSATARANRAERARDLHRAELAETNRRVLLADLPHALPGQSHLAGDVLDGDTDE